MHRRTFAILGELRQSQWWTLGRLRECQLRKLQDLVEMALNRTEWYAEFSGLHSSWRPKSLEDLRQLPLLSKTTINTHREQLANRAVPGGLFRHQTSGSTGNPLIFYFDRRRQAFDKAARMRGREWWAIYPGDREAYIMNSPVELSRQDRIRRFRDWLVNDRIFPASELSPSSISWFSRALRRYNPHCWYGYPSTLSQMCRLAREAQLKLAAPSLKVVFTMAEVLYDSQRRIISESLNVPVANSYGSKDGGYIAHECPHGRMHITSEHIIVEFLVGDRPARSGEDGEIVITNLDNHAMPFIRYRTEDVGQPSDEACPCGRSLEVMRVVKGRSNDFLIAQDGRLIHASAVHAILTDIPGIVKYQFIQEADKRIRILLVQDNRSPASGERIRARILERLGNGGVVSVEYPEDIPLGPSGKYRYIVSHVSQPGPLISA
jgi:phenylacetate-CoA ligase